MATIGWSYPRTLEEALRLLADPETRWEPVAGATSWHFRRPAADLGLMDLSRLPLGAVALEGAELVLGAGLRMEPLRRDPTVASASPLLLDVAEAMRPRQLRNAVTLGGNCLQVFYWSDVPVAALAAGAVFDILGPAGTEQVGADEFFSSQPRRRCEGRLLTALRFPARRPGSGAAFAKLARGKVDLSVASAAVSVEVAGGRVQAARVALGALRGLPQRVSEAEAALVGAAAEDPGLQARVAAAVQAAVEVAHDPRASKEYRREVAGVLAGRVAATALERAQQG